jgi:S1-C subfamily serine protease
MRNLLFSTRAAARAAVVVLGLLAVSGCTLLPAPHQPTARELTDTARAATLLVQSDYSVKMSIPDPTIIQARIDDLDARVQGLIDRGQILTVAAADAYYQNEILTHYDQYIQPGTTSTTHSTNFEMAGSGFLINSGGYLVTAAHVVVPDKDAIRKDYLAAIDDQAIQALTDAVRKDLIDAGVTPTDQQAKAMGQWAADYTKANLQVEVSGASYHVAFGQSIAAGDGVYTSGYTANLVTAGAAVPGIDVAVLHIERNNLPALALGDETRLGLTSRMVEVGYPCQCDIKEGTSPVNMELTTTSGVLGPSDSQDGWTAISTTANGTYGDSGGPVIGPDGKVVGIVSYGYGTSGQTYLVPASVVKGMIAKAGVKAAPGRVTALYAQAQADYEQHRYRWALPIFQEVAKLDPLHPFAADFIGKSEAAIRDGRDRSPADLSPFALPGAGTLLFLLLAGLMIPALRLAVRHRDRAREPRLAVEPES